MMGQDPRTRGLAIGSLAALGLAIASAGGAALACERSDFEGAVGEAAGTLGDMNNRNTPLFQEKLRLLKDKRKWTYDEFVKQAEPLVADEQITAYDQRSADHLVRINTMGDEGANAARPDCKLLDTLRANMTALVETQTQKWAYMFAKVDAELAK
jgi:hypothetical protein